MSQAPDDTPTSDTADGPPARADGGDAPATDDRDPADPGGGDDEVGGRTVVVPTDLYKRVTVFSTLLAVVTVVGGFVVLDSATNRARAPLDQVDPLLALLGLGLIVLGALTYAFSTRFQAEGMGNAKDDTDEPSDNG